MATNVSFNSNPLIKLSIILPVYNVEAYIEKCIVSLERQDIDKDCYEIIAVNDGSPDRSADIIESMARRFNNIVLINKVNEGVSVARNTGIKAARGRYILFVDPDDYLDENCLGIIMSEMERSPSCDVVMVALKEVDLQEEVTYVDTRTESRRAISGVDLYCDFRKVRGETGVDASVGLLMKRAFLVDNDLLYLTGVPYLEDGELIARIFCLANECTFISSPFYNRVIRPGSATQSNLYYEERAINGFIKAAANLKLFQSQRQLARDQRSFLNQPILKFVMLSVQACVRNIGLLRYVKKRLQEERLLYLDLEGCNAFFRLYGSYFNRSVNLFFVAWILRLGSLTIRSRAKNVVNSVGDSLNEVKPSAKGLRLH